MIEYMFANKPEGIRESGVYNRGLGPGLYGLAVEAKDSLAHSGFQVKVRRSRRHTLTTARQEARQPSKAAAMFLGSVAKGLVSMFWCAPLQAPRL